MSETTVARATSKKPQYKVVCGLTGEEITEYRDMLFISTYIDGEKKSIPLHLNKWAILELHNGSPTSKKSRAANAATDTSEVVETDTMDENEPV